MSELFSTPEFRQQTQLGPELIQSPMAGYADRMCNERFGYLPPAATELAEALNVTNGYLMDINCVRGHFEHVEQVSPLRDSYRPSLHRITCRRRRAYPRKPVGASGYNADSG